MTQTLTDEDLLEAFFKSDIWTGGREQTGLKKVAWRDQIKKGRWWDLSSPIRTFLREFFQVPFNAETPEEVEETVRRLKKLYHSRRGVKSAATKKRRRKRKEARERRRLAKVRKALLLKKINRWERKRRTAKRKAKQAALQALKEPTFL